ncbi:WecB/TagA/CpsF family glycosyltransferase [Macrococcus armenti]|uniref:WecB/TagA/CpsF family glycosyltransferase n=1 Tax=Macrococcus armenti TaxID=2875764 RepID=UPI001CCEB53C|nr:WecB/TagA/CpsF family glycosyltransferase [Macrococcus armenti]UBH13770.1 WecB/TagA/CpsF family glycosyltransferase [Macrococcus armenti]
MTYELLKNNDITTPICDVLGVPFNDITNDEALAIIKQFDSLNTHDNLFIVTANPEIAYMAHKNESYMTRISMADLIVPDGIGIIKASKQLGRPMKARVPGIELMEGMLEVANRDHKKVFLLGSSKKTVKKCKKKLSVQFPNITFKSKHGYKEIDDQKTLQKLKDFEPDYVFVAMGFPKQESFIYFNQHHFKHTVFMGVGGSFDVFSGNVRRAPELFIKLNLEWLYRIMTDFKRFKRATTIPMFMLEVRKQMFNEKYDPYKHLKEKE